MSGVEDLFAGPMTQVTEVKLSSYPDGVEVAGQDQGLVGEIVDGVVSSKEPDDGRGNPHTQVRIRGERPRQSLCEILRQPWEAEEACFGTFRGGTSDGGPFPLSGFGSRGPGFGVVAILGLLARRVRNTAGVGLHHAVHVHHWVDVSIEVFSDPPQQLTAPT